MDLLEGARILASRLAEGKPADDRDSRRWSPHAVPAKDVRCVRCGEEMAEILVNLGSLHCHDCRDRPEH